MLMSYRKNVTPKILGAFFLKALFQEGIDETMENVRMGKTGMIRTCQRNDVQKEYWERYIFR